MPSSGATSEQIDVHRIGGGQLENLRLKPAEVMLDPPGISVLRAASSGEAARQIREAFPTAGKLHEAARTVGSTSESLIRTAGFDLLPDRTRRFPNHHRIVHPDGAAGFTDENLKRLADVFIDTSGS